MVPPMQQWSPSQSKPSLSATLWPLTLLLQSWNRRQSCPHLPPLSLPLLLLLLLLLLMLSWILLLLPRSQMLLPPLLLPPLLLPPLPLPLLLM